MKGAKGTILFPMDYGRIFCERIDGQWAAVCVPWFRPPDWQGPIQTVFGPTLGDVAIPLGVRHDAVAATHILYPETKT